MADFYSSKYALDNLFIGLARGYWKERRRLKKQADAKERRHPGTGTGFQHFIYEDAKLRDTFVSGMEMHLGDYFPNHHKRKVAEAILAMVDEFKELK